MRLMPKSEKIQALIFCAAILASISGLWVLLLEVTPERVASPQVAIRANLFIESPSWRVAYVNVSTWNNTAFGILIETSERLNFSVDWTYWPTLDAKKVDAINGIKDGEGNRYWQYWVNGRYGEISADRKEIFDGDVVEWKHERYGA